MAIGRRIKEARLKKSLTQEELAKIVGVTKGAIANYENNTSHPKENVMYALINALGVDANFLFQDFVDIKTAPLYSSEAMQLAKDYDSLDGHGQRVVRLVADEELARCAEEDKEKQARAAAVKEQKRKMEAAEEMVCFIVPWFFMPMSAGTGEIAGDEQPENLRLTREPPKGTSYVAPVSGDSMEPTFQNGDKLFIHACTEIRPGQVGVFLMDGKQWVKELGDGVLISHNSEKYDPIPMREDIQCQGLVLGVCDESYFE